ncbi:MAG: NADH-quinone oxidoreductase subunit L, partial [Rhodobacteraceae bacterium]|nr:NADH-quinone oxidoreductase subunit L [Paracoccaceae bacterium]
LVPLYVLALGAVFAGMVFSSPFIGHGFEEFWGHAIFLGEENHIMHEFHDAPLWAKWSPFVMMLTGFFVAYYFYIVSPDTPARLAQQNRILYEFLLNKWYFDEIYDFLFVRPAVRLGRFLWKWGDGRTIDGLGPDGVAARVVDITNKVVRLQTGYVFHYAFAMLIGVAALVTWLMFAG